MLCNIAGFAGIPCRHICCASDASIRIKNRDCLRGHFQPNEIPQVLHNTVHVHHVNNPSAYWICAIQWRINLNCSGFNVLLRQLDDLSQQRKLCALILPRGVHLLVYLCGCLKNNALHPQFGVQLLQVNFRAFCQIRFSINNRCKVSP